MRLTYTRIPLVCSVFLSMVLGASVGLSSAEERTTPGRMSEATVRGSFDTAVFTIPWRGTLEITALGKATLRSSRGTRRFRLTFDDAQDAITQLSYRQIGTDLLLVGELALGDAGAGFVTRIDSRRLQQRWSLWIPAFNVGPTLVDGPVAYVSAIGFVAKVDLDAGHYEWKHDNLYEPDGSFNNFDVPRLEGRNVVFTSLHADEPDGARLIVDCDTGKIVERRTIHWQSRIERILPVETDGTVAFGQISVAARVTIVFELR